MKVLRLTHISGGGYCIYDAANCPNLHEEINEMQYCEEGEEWKITVKGMKKKKFNALPRFLGW